MDKNKIKVTCPVCDHDKFVIPMTIMGRINMPSKIQLNPKQNGMAPATITSCEKCGTLFNFTLLQRRAVLESERIKNENNP